MVGLQNRSTRSVTYKNDNSVYLGCIIMSPDPYFNLNLSIYDHNCHLLDMLKYKLKNIKNTLDLVSQGFQYYIIFTKQLLIYSKFISNIKNIIERKVYKFNSLHLKCFPGFMQQLENLVFVEFPRFLFKYL